MSYSMFVDPVPQFHASGGTPYAGAKLYFYEAGTTTPITAYADKDGATPLSWPVVADDAGMFPQAFVNEELFKVIIKDAADVTIKTADNISGLPTPLSAASIGGASAAGISNLTSPNANGLIPSVDAVENIITTAIPAYAESFFALGYYERGDCDPITFDVAGAPITVRLPQEAVTIGEYRSLPASSTLALRCTTAGTTSATASASISIGAIETYQTDGTAEWLVVDMAEATAGHRESDDGRWWKYRYNGISNTKQFGLKSGNAAVSETDGIADKATNDIRFKEAVLWLRRNGFHKKLSGVGKPIFTGGIIHNPIGTRAWLSHTLAGDLTSFIGITIEGAGAIKFGQSYIDAPSALIFDGGGAISTKWGFLLGGTTLNQSRSVVFRDLAICIGNTTSASNWNGIAITGDVSGLVVEGCWIGPLSHQQDMFASSSRAISVYTGHHYRIVRNAFTHFANTIFIDNSGGSRANTNGWEITGNTFYEANNSYIQMYGSASLGGVVEANEFDPITTAPSYAIISNGSGWVIKGNLFAGSSLLQAPTTAFIQVNSGSIEIVANQFSGARRAPALQFNGGVCDFSLNTCSTPLGIVADDSSNTGRLTGRSNTYNYQSYSQITGMTNASPCVVTTSTNHSFGSGDSVVFTGLDATTGMAALSGTTQVITVISPTTFSFAVDTTNTTTYPPYTHDTGEPVRPVRHAH